MNLKDSGREKRLVPYERELAVEYHDDITKAKQNGSRWYDIVDTIKADLKAKGRNIDFRALRLEYHYSKVRKQAKK